MYGTLAADTAVFGTIQSIDSVISGFAKDMFADVDTYLGLTGGKLEDNTKTVLRDYIGSEIIRDLMDHRGDYETATRDYRVVLESTGNLGALTYTGKRTENGSYIYIDGDGQVWAFGIDGNWWKGEDTTTITDACFDDSGDVVNWTLANNDVNVRTRYKYDPIAYANAFASAASKAVNSKDGASMLQALYYQVYSAKVLHELTKDGGPFDELRDSVIDWEDGNAILSQYHFHDIVNANWPNGIDNDGFWSPYAMLDVNDYPNTFSSVTDAIFAP